MIKYLRTLPTKNENISFMKFEAAIGLEVHVELATQKDMKCF